MVPCVDRGVDTRAKAKEDGIGAVVAGDEEEGRSRSGVPQHQSSTPALICQVHAAEQARVGIDPGREAPCTADRTRRPDYLPDVQVDDFDYVLPAERIATRPCEPR